MAIDRYHQLWHIEQSFRISRFDLQTRPIYHQKQEVIKAHALICFAALMAEKYLELTTKLSLRKPLPGLEHHDYRNPHPRQPDKANICLPITFKRNIEQPTASLITKWNLLPH